MADSSRDAFLALSEVEQCQLFTLLGELACARANNTPCSSSTQGQASARIACSICDSQLPHRSRNVNILNAENNGLVKVLADLAKLPSVHRSGKPRICAMLASRRVLQHCSEKADLDLAASSLGQISLQALRSSSRDIRIAAG